MEKQKILIADDSEMNRALLVDILEDQYDIVEADNGAAAIDLLTQCGGDFFASASGYHDARNGRV